MQSTDASTATHTLNPPMSSANVSETENAAAWLTAIVESSDDAILSKTLDGIITSWNPGATRLFGFTADEAIGQPITIIIPEDRLSEEATIINKLRHGERVEHFETVRRRKDGSPVDISLTVSPVRDRQGRIIGASKIARDITEARRATERQLLLFQEMIHRIKNLFALTTALVTLSARTAESVEQLKDDVSKRLSSLARAHDLTLTEFGGYPAPNVTTLKALLEAILAPYDEIAAPRVWIDGGDIPVRSGALTSLALLFHELATNAAKYGALSPDGDRLAIHITADDENLALRWQETSPSKIGDAPKSEGFGSHLEQASIRGLSGTIERVWQPDGLVINISFPTARLIN